MKPSLSDLAIQRRSLYDPVAEHLRNMIIKGELTPDARIPVNELATEFGVSQTPMREALKVLAEEGLIELLPNRGARIVRYTVKEAAELFSVIASLESLAAELATARLTPDDLAALEHMHAAMRLYYNEGALELYFDLNSRIHETIMQLSGNDVLITTHAKLNARAARGRYTAILNHQRWTEAMDEHETLMLALRAGEPAAAAAIWRQHLRHTGLSVCNALRSQAD